MADLISSLLDSTPACLAKFIIKPAESSSLNLPKSSSEFITQSIACTCGNEQLFLDASQTKELKGVCTKHDVSSVAPPIYVSCKACKKYTLLFDPFIHGWKGEKGEHVETEEVYKIFRCTEQAGNIFVRYSYQNMDDYQTLLDGGIQNIQDYFSNFTVLYQKTLSEPVRRVYSCECK